METPVASLTHAEDTLLRALECEDPAPIEALRPNFPDGLIPIRATVLRRLILGPQACPHRPRNRPS